MRSVFKYMLLSLALLHLSLVTLSAVYVPISKSLPFRSALEFYAKASGADSSYGFFAPSIGTKVRGVFDVVNKKGEMQSNIPFASEMNREESIRLGGIFDEFTSEDAEDEEFRKPLATSLAAAVFSRYEDAVNVVLHVEEYPNISMEEFRSGKRSQWEKIYEAKFERTLAGGKTL